MTDGPAFFRAIEADPEEDTPRLVYADWLDENAASESDRARAEFIRVQCELAREPEGHRTELESRARDLLGAHAAAWAVWPVKLLDPRYHRGFIDPVPLPATAFAPNAGRLAELMPLFHLRLVRARGALRAVAACPQLALARRLTLAGAWLRNAEMTALAAAPPLGALRHLDLSHNQIGIRGATDLAATRAPALLALNIGTNPIRDRGLLALALADWPALEHLDATECGLGAAGVIGLAESPLLRRVVSLQLSRNPRVTSAAWAALARAPMERLERLDLSNPAVTDETVEALATNPATAQLRVLHLGTASITDRGARALLNALHLRGLMRLCLPETRLSAAVMKQLRAAFGFGFALQV
jgi:uncharacterized protein (TIGR02996 family)